MKNISDDDKDVVQAICEAYESGFGHGFKKDGLDLSKTPHENPLVGYAYQQGYDAGLEKSNQPEAPVQIPEGYRFLKTDYHFLFWALGEAVVAGSNTLTISVRKFLEYLDKNDPISIKEN